MSGVSGTGIDDVKLPSSECKEPMGESSLSQCKPLSENEDNGVSDGCNVPSVQREVDSNRTSKSIKESGRRSLGLSIVSSTYNETTIQRHRGDERQGLFVARHSQQDDGDGNDDDGDDDDSGSSQGKVIVQRFRRSLWSASGGG